MFPVLILFRECWPGLVELSWSWVLRQWYVFINTTLVNTHLIVLMFHFSPQIISTDWWLSLRTWGEQSVVLSVFCYLIPTLNTDHCFVVCSIDIPSLSSRNRYTGEIQTLEKISVRCCDLCTVHWHLVATNYSILPQRWESWFVVLHSLKKWAQFSYKIVKSDKTDLEDHKSF